MLKKDFNPLIIKNERWSTSLYTTLNGTEHFFESELSEFADQLFFKDQINLFEVYNGLKKAHSLNKELHLDEAIKHLEAHYGDQLTRKNDQYLEIDATHRDALSRTTQALQHSV